MKILFVCHGNICRSVMAEMILRQMVETHNIPTMEIASCATSTEELGNDIYPPAKECLRRHGVFYTQHSARQITMHDLNYYDAIYCMDCKLQSKNDPRSNRKMYHVENRLQR